MLNIIQIVFILLNVILQNVTVISALVMNVIVRNVIVVNFIVVIVNELNGIVLSAPAEWHCAE
jgi:hypothetical protein